MMTKWIILILLIINLIYSMYEWGLYAYNARTSSYDVEYYQEIHNKSTNRYKDIKILEDWKCRNFIYNINRREWATKLYFDLLILSIFSIWIIKNTKKAQT
jgi:hypothetical protein